jgi:myo-inositol 2-dehydrogenase / D-chiro-inositol 1-dehydrogenase
MGRTHGASWKLTPATLAGVFSDDSVGAARFAADFGGTVYPSFDALIRDVDVVDICTPTHLHHEMVIAAAQAGKMILCEKPLARTAAQGEAMIEAVRKAGVPLLIGHVVRFFPEYALAKATVDRGEIGKVAVVRLTRASFKPSANNPNSWFHDLAKSGGAMLDLMIHDFDYARWVAGDVDRVTAMNVSSRRPNAPHEYALTVLRHANGALSHVEGGWAYPPPLFRTALEIAGDRGLIEHPAGSSTPIEIHRAAKNSDTPEIATPTSPLLKDPYAVEIEHFYRVLNGTIPTPRVTDEDALAALRIALAAIQSAQTGRSVSPAEVQ